MLFELSIFELSNIIGSLAFALSGLLVGIRKELDVMGMFIVSMLTANGGGAVRDVLVGRTPGVLTDPSAFYLVLAVLITAWVFKLHRYATLERHSLFIISDAIGLVAFSITGALVGIEAGLSIFGVMVLSFLTAAGGGIIRDMMVNDVPAILDSDFYGSIALLMAAALYGMHHYSIASNLHITLLFFFALALRLYAYKKGWQLPRLTL